MATNSRFVLILILILTILIAIPAAEALRIVSAVNGDWDVAGTWTGGVPNPIDDVYISHVVSVVGDYHVNISSLGVSGTLNMNFNETAKLNVTGNVTIENGGTIHLGDLNSEMSNITILSGGHLNSTSGILNITDRNFTNSGSFTHNAGRVVMGGGTGENQSITGNNETTFFNLNITNLIVNTTIEQNTTIEGVLHVDNKVSLILDGTDKHLHLTFGNLSGGHTEMFLGAIGNARSLSFAGNKINPVTIRGANAMHQAFVMSGNGTSIVWESGGSGSTVNLKWLYINNSLTSTSNGGTGVTINITGNISTSVSVDITNGNIFNATQPGTNISGVNSLPSYAFKGNLNILGSMSQPIQFLNNRVITINEDTDNTGIVDIQYVVITPGQGADGALKIYGSPYISKIDNITINTTNRATRSYLEFISSNVLITNSTFAGEAPLNADPKDGRSQQIGIDDSNFTCIRCNFSLVGQTQSTVQIGHVININATNPETGEQTNDIHMWGRVHSNGLNASWGAQPSNWSANANVTLHRFDGSIGIYINTTLVSRENFTVANITITNGSFFNISSGNSARITNNLWLNGTLNIGKNSNLTVMKNASIQNVGFLNSFEGNNPITLGSLETLSNSIINSTAGTLSIIEGNWTNAGAYTANGGRVIFNSTNAQHINGTSVTSFFNLNITNQIGLHQEQNATITNMLSIAAGASYRVYPGMLVNQTENSSINGTLQIDNKARFAVSDKGHAVFTGLSTLTLNGKLEVIEGELFNATINSTKITLNGSNIFLSNVVTTPIDARDIENLQLANIGKYVNITNLTSTPIMDLNFTYSDNDVPNLAVNEVNLDIYKFNDSDSKWYGTKTGTINTTTNIVSVENYTFIGSVFAAMIRDFVAPAVTSGGTASTSAGETIDIPSITDQKTSTLVDVTQGTETVITNDETAIPITEITFKSDTDVQGVIITIETFNDVKPDFLGDIANVYDYMQVSIEDIENKLFGLEELAEIKFKVTKEWLELNGLDKKKIKLFIWEDEAWRELDTILLAEEESTIEYKALSDDIDAYFAIALASAATPVEKSKLPFISTIPPVETGNIVFSFIIIIVFILIAINFLKSKKKRGWFEALIMKNRR